VRVLETSDPLADVPIFSVVCPPGPDQIFLSSIEPVLRVFVNVHTTTSPLAREIELPAPGENDVPLLVHASDGV